MDFFISLLFLTFTLFHSTFSGQEIMHVYSMSENDFCNDPYQTSLNDLLTYLKNEAPTTGFIVASKGEGENRTCGLALCRGDLSSTDCGNCVVKTVSDMLKDCPYNKGAMILHEDCTVKYSNEDYFGQTMHNSMLCLTSQNNASYPSPEWFSQKTREFLSQITRKAVLDPMMYATGKSEIDEYSTVCGCAYCNRELSWLDCNECLNQLLAYLKACDEDKEEVRVYNGIC